MSAEQEGCLLVRAWDIVAMSCLVRLKIDQDEAEPPYMCIYDCNEATYNHTKPNLIHISKA